MYDLFTLFLLFVRSTSSNGISSPLNFYVSILPYAFTVIQKSPPSPDALVVRQGPSQSIFRRNLEFVETRVYLSRPLEWSLVPTVFICVVFGLSCPKTVVQI